MKRALREKVERGSMSLLRTFIHLLVPSETGGRPLISMS
jgi:hypothetical protein